MGKYDVSKNARCPHYRSEEKVQQFRIRCDGLQPMNWIHMVFATKDDLLQWRDQKCKRCWKECPIAKMLENAGESRAYKY